MPKDTQPHRKRTTNQNGEYLWGESAVGGVSCACLSVELSLLTVFVRFRGAYLHFQPPCLLTNFAAAIIVIQPLSVSLFHLLLVIILIILSSSLPTHQESDGYSSGGGDSSGSERDSFLSKEYHHDPYDHCFGGDAQQQQSKSKKKKTRHQDHTIRKSRERNVLPNERRALQEFSQNSQVNMRPPKRSSTGMCECLCFGWVCA